MQIIFRNLEREELEKYRQIDRGEAIDGIYYLRDGRLVLEREHYDMKGFMPGELDRLMRRQVELLEDGGEVAGAFEGERLVGITSVERRIRGRGHRYVKMDVLHVSRAYRRRGIGARLVRLAKSRAHEFGGERLYVSATPSRNTVDFYVHNGARIAREVDEELFGMEPEDIHLEMDAG